MSKKSRRRNKKILAALALAGGAAMAGRGKGTASVNPVGGLDAIVRRKAKRDAAIDAGVLANVHDSESDMAPRKKFLGIFKKGGRVTGIAKRGFGRALMKGKK